MSKKLNLTSQQILDKVFPGVSRGYDPLIVDQFLDVVLKDYQVIEENELLGREEIDALKEEMEKLKKENYELTVENGLLKNKTASIKDGQGVTRDNLDLLRRIDKLEKLCYEHSIDISSVK